MSLIYSFKSLKRSECKKWMRERCVLGDILPIQYKTSPTVFAVVGRGRGRSVDSFDAEMEAYRINKNRKTFNFGVVQFEGRTLFEMYYPNEDYSKAEINTTHTAVDTYGRPTGYVHTSAWDLLANGMHRSIDAPEERHEDDDDERYEDDDDEWYEDEDDERYEDEEEAPTPLRKFDLSDDPYRFGDCKDGFEVLKKGFDIASGDTPHNHEENE